MKQQPLTFITGNMNKLQQVNDYLDHPIEHIEIDLVEIQSLDPLKIAEYKANEAYKQLKKPILIEDTSLFFNALGKLPGPFIKWFYDELGPQGLCRLLDNYEDRSAMVWIIFAYYDGITVRIFDAKQDGTITDHPRGENGFGWNPIFVPKGEKRTFAEMPPEEHKENSIRRRALLKLKQFLQENE